MCALLSGQGLAKAFGAQTLFTGVSLGVDRGDRVGLIGPNGSGKSTLLRILCGLEPADSGTVALQKLARTAYLAQEDMFDDTASCVDNLLAAAADLDMDEAERYSRALAVLSRAGFDDPLQPVRELSGGWRKRLAVCRALVGRPDVLVMDEPTNHLDIATIEWLEEFLLKQVETLLFVTHDRRFLKRLATRVLDLDRGRLTSWACGYDAYVARKEAGLAAEAVQQAEFDRRLAQEEKWIRTGILARRTRNEGRARRLINMRRQRQDRRERAGSARMQLQEADRSGRLVAELKGVSFTYGDRPIIRHLSTLVMRGDRIGIIGPNGAGKTTLLRVILGQLPPTEGALRHGTRLQVAYFDQLHAHLDLQKSVVENLAGGSDSVLIEGKKKHVYGYLQDFLFTPDRAKSPVWQLSGGERNRLLLARLFAKPSNVLVMDEPTNDLDAETLDLLEEVLLEYSGTVLLVSHDREFLNNVVTSTLVFEGEGEVHDYAGGYDDWLVQRSKTPPDDVRKPENPSRKRRRSRRAAADSTRRRWSWKPCHGGSKSRRAARGTPDTMADPAFYQQDRQSVSRRRPKPKPSIQLGGGVRARWEELEGIGGVKGDALWLGVTGQWGGD